MNGHYFYRMIDGVPYVHPLMVIVLALAGSTLERLMWRLYQVMRTIIRFIPYR